MKLFHLCTFVCFVSSLAAVEIPVIKSIQQIPLPRVKGRFDHFAMDTVGNRLFVAALGNNTLEVIDLTKGERVRSVPSMSKPTGVLYLPGANEIYVANGNDGTLKVLGGSDCHLIETLAGVDDADNLRLEPDGQRAWLGFGDGELARIDARSVKSFPTVKLMAHPESFQLEPHGNRVFVNLPDARQIAVIDRDRLTVIATWRMEKFRSNFPMALDDSSHRLFVGCRTPPRLIILDTESGKQVADAEISGDTDDLFYDQKRKRIYISCGEGFVDVVEQGSPDVWHRINRVPTAPGARTSLFSAATDRFYLAVPARGANEAEIRVYEPR